MKGSSLLTLATRVWVLCCQTRPTIRNRKWLANIRPATGVFLALRARSVPGKPGVSEGISHGVSLGPFASWARECPKSVLRASPECLGCLFETPGTLSGHFLDTPRAQGPNGPRDTLWDTPSNTPCFPGTLSGTLPGYFLPEGPERLLWQAGGFLQLDTSLAITAFCLEDYTAIARTHPLPKEQLSNVAYPDTMPKLAEMTPKVCLNNVKASLT